MIEFKDVSFAYQNHLVLQNISFSIKKGKYTCIIGHNGSGKSTVAKLMVGLEVANQGMIKVNDNVMNPENVMHIRNQIGIVFQNPDNQFIGATVEDDIAFTLENACVPQENMQEMIDKYARAVNMENFLQHEPEKLSGGQKQRVALASVLASNSEIIILDEATSMLDPKGKKSLLELVYGIHQIQKTTIVSITHDMEEVLLADEIIVLHQGKILKQGNVQEIFDDVDVIEKTKLQYPFIMQVKNEAKKLGIDTSDCFELEKVVEKICQFKSKM